MVKEMTIMEARELDERRQRLERYKPTSEKEAAELAKMLHEAYPNAVLDVVRPHIEKMVDDAVKRGG